MYLIILNALRLSHLALGNMFKVLLLFVDSFPSKKLYSLKEMDNIKNLIEKESIQLTTKEHVDNIKILKELRKQH